MENEAEETGEEFSSKGRVRHNYTVFVATGDVILTLYLHVCK